MRLYSRLFFAVLLLTSLNFAAYPQKRMCPKPPPSPFKHDGQIVTSFDSRAGGMRTTLEHPRPLGSGAGQFYLGASFMYQDPRRPAAPTLDIVFYSATPESHLRAGQDLVFVLDGESHTFTRNVSYKSQSGLDTARITLSYADASAITHAHRVVTRVGG